MGTTRNNVKGVPDSLLAFKNQGKQKKKKCVRTQVDTWAPSCDHTKEAALAKA